MEGSLSPVCSSHFAVRHGVAMVVGSVHGERQGSCPGAFPGPREVERSSVSTSYDGKWAGGPAAPTSRDAWPYVPAGCGLPVWVKPAMGGCPVFAVAVQG